MILFIDTTKKGQIIFGLLEDGRETARKKVAVEKQSEEMLVELQKFLRENQIELTDIEKVEINPGPGPFTSVRAGVAAANALVFALGLEQELILPKYSKPPNITKPKDKPKNQRT